MTAVPSHGDLREMLPAAALEILESADLDLVLAHTRGCWECARELEEYRAVAFSLETLMPGQEPAPPASLRVRVLERARHDRRRDRLARAGSVANKWLGWTVAAGLAGVLLMHHAVHRPLDYGWLASGALAVLLVVTVVYAVLQRNRVSALQARFTALERETEPSNGDGPDEPLWTRRP